MTQINEPWMHEAFRHMAVQICFVFLIGLIIFIMCKDHNKW